MTHGREAGPYNQEQQFPQYPPPGSQPQHWAPAPTQPRRRKTGSMIVLALVVLGIGALVAVGWMAGKSSPDKAAVGDCVARDGADSIKIVSCTDSKSAYEVVGKVPDKTQVQFSISSRSICKAFPKAKTAYWKGEAGGKGYVLCLGPVK
jgi:hypothetical protein